MRYTVPLLRLGRLEAGRQTTRVGCLLRGCLLFPYPLPVALNKEVPTGDPVDIESPVVSSLQASASGGLTVSSSVPAKHRQRTVERPPGCEMRSAIRKSARSNGSSH